MSRNFTHTRTGRLNFQIKKNYWIHWHQSRGHYELLNLDNNKVECDGYMRTTDDIEFRDLQAGNYQLTLQNIPTDILTVDLWTGIMCNLRNAFYELIEICLQVNPFLRS
jgi:hypothetical protein